MPSTEATLTPGVSGGIGLDAIERELTLLWQREEEPTADGSPEPVVRACSMNLVIVTDELSELDALGQLAGGMAAEHPSRIMLVALDRKGSGAAAAWISIRCMIPEPGGKQVCCEQISIVAPGAEITKVPPLITSLLVSDVPTVLFWKATVVSGDAVLASLAQLSDRVFMDSSEDPNPEARLRAWIAFVRAYNGRGTFGDLTWTHITEWRALIAQAYQPPEFRGGLGTIDEVSIAYSEALSHRHSGLSQSLLMIGWLADRLGWKPASPLKRENGNGTMAWANNGRTIDVRLARRPGVSPTRGGIEEIMLHSSSGQTVAVEWLDERGCARLRTSQGSEIRDAEVSTVKERSEEELIARELEILQRDAVYEGSLARLGTALEVR